MPPLSSLGLLLFSLGVLGAAFAQLVPSARGHDWYSEDGARHMRRAMTIAGCCYAVAFGGGAVVTAIDEPAAAPWALPIGAFGLAFGIAIVIVARRRTAIDPSRRAANEGPEARRRASIVGGAAFIALGVVLSLVVGATSSWLAALGSGIAFVVLGVLFAVLVRIDWGARGRQRRRGPETHS